MVLAQLFNAVPGEKNHPARDHPHTMRTTTEALRRLG